jgi:DNA invertase Pin-like site-specific DNA recombinase
VKAVSYARVSTADQQRSGLGLSSQREAVRVAASLRGWEIVAELEDAASGSTLDRPSLALALSMIDAGDAQALVVAKLDRATRSVGDFARLLDRLGRRDAAFVALDLGVDTSTPGGRLVANVIASVAEWERDVISQRTRDALRQLPRERRGGPVYDDATRKRTRALRAKGLPFHVIAKQLMAEGVVPPRGGTRIWPNTVQQLLGE